METTSSPHSDSSTVNLNQTPVLKPHHYNKTLISASPQGQWSWTMIQKRIKSLQTKTQRTSFLTLKIKSGDRLPVNPGEQTQV